jgi:hypothetical protein
MDMVRSDDAKAATYSKQVNNIEINRFQDFLEKKHGR